MGRPKGAAGSPRKKAKDANKPKRSTSAYFFYLAHCREQASKAGRSISKIAEFTKECSAKWREMPASQKKQFEDSAAKDKERYDKEMAMYKGKKSDPNKPKRPMTAYFIFLGDFRTKMKNRGVDHKEILRLAGEEWRNMSAEQKKPYEKRSVDAGKKYESEMAEYRKTQGAGGTKRGAALGDDLDDEENGDEDDEEEDEDDEDDDDK
ncbi:high mobility group protein B2-like [Pomacea canaliculata]|uniref:high mobility group protein B2-like n=1 Tax=Pomacea canaliculata TaxID=400727 RepID=UPI000D729543|nr:high mobility group protein B2-like [Pomacea canaliculata]